MLCLARKKPLTEAQTSQLFTLIGRIEHALEVGAGPLDKHLHQTHAATRLLAELVKEGVAKTSFSCGTNTIQMAGVRASCTAGSLGLLRNWQAAATRTLDRGRA